MNNDTDGSGYKKTANSYDKKQENKSEDEQSKSRYELDNILKAFRESLDQFGKDVGSILKDVKEETYKIAGSIEQKIEKKEGVIGEIADVAGETYKSIKTQHEKIKSSGGYTDFIENRIYRLFDEIEMKIKKFRKDIDEKTDITITKLEEKISKSGIMDFEKIKQAVKDEALTIKEIGLDAYTNLVQIVNEGADNLKKDFRNYIPPREERETKYKGIGVGAEKRIIFRKDFEACISYMDNASNRIPDDNALKNDILNDIKGLGCQNSKSLREHYAKQYAQGIINGEKFQLLRDAIMRI